MNFYKSFIPVLLAFALLISPKLNSVNSAEDSNGYNNNWNNNYNNGYNNNYNNGYNNNYNNGFNNGYNNNWNNGYKNQYDPLSTTFADMAVNSASISCHSNENNVYSCTYVTETENHGPDTAVSVNITDAFFPKTALFSGPFFEITPYTTCVGLTYTYGCRRAAYYDVYLFGGTTITHTVTVNSDNDPDFSNNVFTESFDLPPGV